MSEPVPAVARIDLDTLWRTAFARAPIPMAVVGVGEADLGRLLMVNQALARFVGIPIDELLGSSFTRITPPEHVAPRLAAFREMVARGGAQEPFVKRYERADGTSAYGLVSVSIVHDADGLSRFALCQAQDITDLRRAQGELEKAAARMSDTLGALEEGVITMELDGRVVEANPAATRILGFDPRDGGPDMAQPWWVRTDARDGSGRPIGPANSVGAQAVAAGHPMRANSLRIRRPAGERRDVRVNYRPVIDEATGAVRRLVISFTDVTDEQERGRRARVLAEQARTAFSESPIGMALLGLDGRFQEVNQALCSMLRYDRGDLMRTPWWDLVHPEEREMVRLRADALVAGELGHSCGERRYLAQDAGEVHALASIVALRDADGTTTALFAQLQDVTATQQDRAERARREEQLAESLSWIERIRDALEHDRFVVYGQPIFRLDTGEPIQRELLIRMVGADGELIGPGRFLPVAERYGLIREIDRWMLGRAIDMAAGGEAVQLNVSAASVGDASFLGGVRSALERTGADPRLVSFELTETSLIDNHEAAIGFAEGVRALGCSLALDDFGTGYGGLAYATRLPVDELKIDVEFVRSLPADERAAHVVRAVVGLARDLGCRTVAEGVESAETLEVLRELGVDRAQGYWLGMPAPVETAPVEPAPVETAPVHPTTV